MIWTQVWAGALLAGAWWWGVALALGAPALGAPDSAGPPAAPRDEARPA